MSANEAGFEQDPTTASAADKALLQAAGTAAASSPPGVAESSPTAGTLASNSPPGTADSSSTSASRRFWKLDPRFLPPILISLILLGGNATMAMLESPWKTGLAILTAILAEIILSRITLGRWPHLASAYVTGISVGILVRSPFYWPYALCSALAVASKYAIRYRGRHIFNPSNLGIVAMLFLAPAAVASLSFQWGNQLALMIPIWLVGLMVLRRLRRLHITLTYLGAFVFLAYLRSLVTGDPFLSEVAPVTGPMYQLFAMFMVTDPRTTVSTRRGQIGVVLLVALAESGLRLLESVHAPYYALFLVGPAALVFERSRKVAPI